MKNLLSNPIFDFVAFAAIFIGIEALANFIPWLQWPVLGLNAMLFLAIVSGIVVALYNGIKGWINNKTGGTPPAPPAAPAV